ncbi:hypothetical protein [Desulfosporosinus hippei]|uniref:hypothetical protein n=1 Tax=Desulfosporosinus hippei TaxID=569859 RepID=UPI0015A018D2|nr:hypothetical protein [Desulfosporosinus hippei]
MGFFIRGFARAQKAKESSRDSLQQLPILPWRDGAPPSRFFHFLSIFDGYKYGFGNGFLQAGGDDFFLEPPFRRSSTYPYTTKKLTV